MNVTNNNRNNRSILSLFRRGERWREIPPGYRAGDIHSDIPIVILPESSVMGNVFAPKILVEGVLYGSAVALEVTIEHDGQVWGDVYSNRLQVEPGGKLQGWVSNLDGGTFEFVQVDGLIPDELQDRTVELSQLPAEAVEGGRLARSENQVNVLRRLQMESAAALAARDELERAFETRLSETAGEATARAASLHEELSSLRLELTTLREERDEVREELRERTAQVERQANEIITARELLAGRTEELGSLQNQHDLKLDELGQLQQAKNALDSDMLAASKQIDALTDRLRSIESALQNSLQHASEQEESLIRWQELAEVTEAKGQTLQVEIDNLKFQATENGRLNDMLRAQRKHAEEAWQAALQELEELRKKETMRLIPPEIIVELDGQIGELKTALEQAQVETEAKEQTWLAQTEQLKVSHDAKLAHLEEQYEVRQAQTQQEITKAKQALQRSQELMLWDKATLEKAEAALAQAEAKLSSGETAVAQLQNELKAKQLAEAALQKHLAQLKAIVVQHDEQTAGAQDLLAAKNIELAGLQEELASRETAVPHLQQEISQLQATMTKLTQAVEAGKKRLSQVEEQAALEASELRQRVQEARTQMDAQEAETEDYFQQMQEQGQRLAEMQATLIEREITLSQVKETAEKQKALIGRMKEVTTERINKLNDELTKTRQQLRQAVDMVNKLK